MSTGAKDSKRMPPPPLAMVIFGANGDLTRRLVLPALYNLSKSGLLPERIAIIGLDHNEKTVEQWRIALHDFLQKAMSARGSDSDTKEIDGEQWQKLGAAMSYVTADFQDPTAFKRLAEHLADRDRKEQLAGNVLFYLAVPDRFFGPIIDNLGNAGLLEDGHGFRRVVIEKPFGHDLESAQKLNVDIHRRLREDQIYRIDHFLGKETVQNILALRFANGLFEPIWNRDRIDHIQITVAESIGIEGRGNFYEQTGALRDMIPNHLFQLVAMTAMEPPSSFDADAVRAKKAEVFMSVHPLRPEDAVRGQYGAGKIGEADVRAYREEDKVGAGSFMETYVALRLQIDNWRWAGVPFYLRTGKRLPKRTTEIAIRFKAAPFMLFRDTPVDELGANWLILQIQPDEGIRLRFNAKVPGPDVELESVAMDFHYSDWFKRASEVGYETLLYDCFMGDPTLFQRADQVEATWAIVEPLLDAWLHKPSDDFPNYAAGSPGPKSADDLLARDGRAWRTIR
jgi:glucose-6-phosphate 1-dehydrogenase